MSLQRLHFNGQRLYICGVVHIALDAIMTEVLHSGPPFVSVVSKHLHPAYSVELESYSICLQTSPSGLSVGAVVPPRPSTFIRMSTFGKFIN